MSDEPNRLQALLQDAAAFRAWLEQRQQQYFDTGNGGSCPIATWLKDSGLPEAHASSYYAISKAGGDAEYVYYFDDGDPEVRPYAWAGSVIAAVDRRDAPIRGDDVLAILTQIERD